MSTDALRQAIEALPIPVLWRRLGLPGEIRGKCTVRSPLRSDDRHPSFSIYADGRRYVDHSTKEGGDSFDFFCAIAKLDKRAAYPQFLALAGVGFRQRNRRFNRWAYRPGKSS
jgi:hypothetical protein